MFRPVGRSSRPPRKTAPQKRRTARRSGGMFRALGKGSVLFWGMLHPLGERFVRWGKCSTASGECSTHLGKCSTYFGECLVRLGECSTTLGECATRLGKCSTRLGKCSTRLGECSTLFGETFPKIDGTFPQSDGRLSPRSLDSPCGTGWPALRFHGAAPRSGP